MPLICAALIIDENAVALIGWLAMRYADSLVPPCFDPAILMAMASHSLEFWNDQLLGVLGTRTKDNVLFLESITFSS